LDAQRRQGVVDLELVHLSQGGPLKRLLAADDLDQSDIVVLAADVEGCFAHLDGLEAILLSAISFLGQVILRDVYPGLLALVGVMISV
jgi:hypothetical protein